MELYKNQISWDRQPAIAINPRIKPDIQPLAEGFAVLNDVANNIQVAAQKAEDDALISDLNLAEQQSKSLIDNAKDASGNYENLRPQIEQIMGSALSKHSAAARNRFLRERPTYIDQVKLDMSDRILSKKRGQLELQTEQDLDMWTKQALIEGTPEARNMVMYKIEDRLGNISSPETIMRLKQKANMVMDKAVVTGLILNGDEKSLKMAEKALTQASTLDAAEIVEYKARIKAQRDENKKNEENIRKTLLSPIVKEETDKYSIIAQDLAIKAENDRLTKSPEWVDDVMQMKQLMDQLGSDGIPLIENIDSGLRENIRRTVYNFDKMRNAAFADASTPILKNVGFTTKQNIGSVADVTTKQLESLITGIKPEVKKNLSVLERTAMSAFDAAELIKSGGYSLFSPREEITELTDINTNGFTAQQAIVTFSDEMRSNVYTDVAENTNAELAIMAAGIFLMGSQQGLFRDTGLSVTQKKINDTLDILLRSLKDGGQYNQTVSEKSGSIISDFGMMLAGRKLTESETEIVNNIDNLTKSAQGQRGTGELNMYFSRPDSVKRADVSKTNVAKTQSTINFMMASTKLAGKTRVAQKYADTMDMLKGK